MNKVNFDKEFERYDSEPIVDPEFPDFKIRYKKNDKRFFISYNGTHIYHYFSEDGSYDGNRYKHNANGSAVINSCVDDAFYLFGNKLNFDSYPKFKTWMQTHEAELRDYINNYDLISTKSVTKNNVVKYTDEFDRLHRLDGPAYIDGEYQEWWYYGINIPVKSQKDFEETIKINYPNHLKEIKLIESANNVTKIEGYTNPTPFHEAFIQYKEDDNRYSIVTQSGAADPIYYFSNDIKNPQQLLHRLDGPAYKNSVYYIAGRKIYANNNEEFENWKNINSKYLSRLLIQYGIETSFEEKGPNYSEYLDDLNNRHRLEGPAFIDHINKDNNQWYYKNTHIVASSQEEFENHILKYHSNDLISVNQIIRNQSLRNKSGVKMSEKINTKMNFSQMLAQDAQKATMRSGATAGINALKAGLSKAFESQGMDSEGLKSTMKFLDTPMGEGLLRMALGAGMTYIPVPMIQENKYAQALAEELRVSGISKGMDKGMEMLQQFIFPALLEAFKNTPLMNGEATEAVGGPRVAQRVPDEQEIDVELEEPQKLSATA